MCPSKNKTEYFNSKPFNLNLTWNYSYKTFSTNFKCLFFTFTSFAKKKFKKIGVWRNTLIVFFLALKSKICDNWLTKQILFLRNIFQNHPSEKIFGHLNFHLFSYFLGFRISKIRKKTVTSHNPFFFMQKIHWLLSKNKICLLVLMNFTFYFEIKRENPVFLCEKGLLKWIREGCFNWKNVQK